LGVGAAGRAHGRSESVVAGRLRHRHAPVDLLIMAMEQLGAKVEVDAGYVVARAPGGLKGGEIVFPRSPSAALTPR